MWGSSLQPEGLLYPAVRVAFNVEPRGPEPADGVLFPLQRLVALQVEVPALRVLQLVHQGQHRLVCLQLVPQLGQQADGRLLCPEPLLGREHQPLD